MQIKILIFTKKLLLGNFSTSRPTSLRSEPSFLSQQKCPSILPLISLSLSSFFLPSFLYSFLFFSIWERVSLYIFGACPGTSTVGHTSIESLFSVCIIHFIQSIIPMQEMSTHSSYGYFYIKIKHKQSVQDNPSKAGSEVYLLGESTIIPSSYWLLLIGYNT